MIGERECQTGSMETAETGTIQIVLNGKPRDVPKGFSLEKLLQWLEIDASRVAVERNREIARKASWGETEIQSGDQLEVVWFVGGGR